MIDVEHSSPDGKGAYGFAMEFRVLGNVEVLDRGSRKTVGGPKQRGVLALIVSQAGAVVSVDRIIEDVWGESPELNARRSLQTHVSKIRAEIGDVIGHRGDGYFFSADPQSIDAVRFEALEREASEVLDEDPDAASALLREALGLWRGHPYADVDSRGELGPEITRLNELRLTTLSTRIEVDLALGRHRELIGELEALAAEFPLREGFRAQLMVALYRSGRQADALRAYERGRRYLGEEVGIDPSPDLRRLEQQILEQDESLDLVQGPAIQQVAVLVVDVGDTRHLGTLDPVDRDALVDTVGDALAFAADDTDGNVFAHRGAASYVSFREVSQAARAVVAMVDHLGGWEVPNLPRAAIDVGDVEIQPGGELSGAPIARAATLVAAAHRGQVLLSAQANRVLTASEEGGWQVRSLGSHQFHGFDRASLVYQLVLGGQDGFPPLRTDTDPLALPRRGQGLPGYELRDLVGSGGFWRRLSGVSGVGRSGSGRQGDQIRICQSPRLCPAV